MKSISIFAMLMILLTSYSINLKAQVGIQAGASFANWSVKPSDSENPFKYKTGITAGLFTRIPFGTGFSLQPAINFVQKGCTQKDEYSIDKITLNYIEIPVNFVYTLKDNGFFIGAGPSVAFGISGKEKYVDKSDPSYSETNTIKFGTSTDDESKLKPTDIGANLLAGYQMASGFLITANYNIGLSDIHNWDTDEKVTLKNNYFSIRIGYLLKQKK